MHPGNRHILRKACLREEKVFWAGLSSLAVAVELPQLLGAPGAGFLSEISGEECLRLMPLLYAWHLLAVGRSDLHTVFQLR